MVKSLVVVTGTKGGLSDVGKYAAVHALQEKELKVRIIAMSLERIEGKEKVIEVDPGSNKDEVNRKDQIRIKEELELVAKDIIKVDVESNSCQTELETIFEEVDVVISCLGNRQPNMSRWLALGSNKITKAMKAKNVPRIIQLSSMGIGDDFIPLRGIRLFWSCLLRTFLRSTFNDLRQMEHVIIQSQLDYILVRPVGIPPELAPKGKWRLIQSAQDAKEQSIDFALSKSDVALFMVQEAINPTMHKIAVTIAPKTEIKAP